MFNEKEPNSSKKGKIQIALAVISFIGLAILIVVEYTPDRGKQFGTDSFYASQFAEEIDPQMLYDNLYGTALLDENQCAKEMYRASDPMAIGSLTWIVEGELPDGGWESLQEMYPYTSDNKDIISPSNLVFYNSNTVQLESGIISIAAYIGYSEKGKYMIRWDNVESWWCHNGKDNPNRHSEVIGKNGRYSKCVGGYVIGRATESTKVSVYVRNSEGGYDPCTFGEIFK